MKLLSRALAAAFVCLFAACASGTPPVADTDTHTAVFEWVQYAGTDPVFARKPPPGHFQNPVIAGFHPDPSIVRREEPADGMVLAQRSLAAEVRDGLTLKVDIDRARIDFAYGADGEAFTTLLGEADARVLTTAVAGRFVGAVVGPYVHGAAKPWPSPATASTLSARTTTLAGWTGRHHWPEPCAPMVALPADPPRS